MGCELINIEKCLKPKKANAQFVNAIKKRSRQVYASITAIELKKFAVFYATHVIGALDFSKKELKLSNPQNSILSEGAYVI